jgi:hypothetical protein
LKIDWKLACYQVAGFQIRRDLHFVLVEIERGIELRLPDEQFLHARA